ncbi:hypothetical protein J2S25_003706 [Mesobacillus stamsii]|uniref:Uncharacterized protein n=1 Tax=Mesobacillus stamsii TaxID=225347 RepID=A0ABU0G1N3_9BACI|nr:hypothetical protein [Mesobacillus stamsii]
MYLLLISCYVETDETQGRIEAAEKVLFYLK